MKFNISFYKNYRVQDEHGTDESLDNENDKIDTTETTNDSEQIVVSQPKKRLYLCTFCQKAFQASSSLKIHERIHTGEEPFECETCKKRFKRKSVLKEHEVIHTAEMPFECNTCMKVFKTKSNLFQHTKRSHTEVHKTFKCEICHKAYQTKGALKKHKNVHPC